MKERKIKVGAETVDVTPPGVRAILDEKTWNAFWRDRLRQEPPKVDFAKHLVVAGFVPGDNSVFLSEFQLDDAGTLTFTETATKNAPEGGYGYHLVAVPRDGVKTIRPR